MSKITIVPDADNAWDSGALGRDIKHVKKHVPSAELESAIDESFELQAISIRLNKGLIDDLKFIGKLNGIGYQPLIRQVLRRFVHSEIKMLLKEQAFASASADSSKTPTKPNKKAA